MIPGAPEEQDEEWAENIAAVEQAGELMIANRELQHEIVTLKASYEAMAEKLAERWYAEKKLQRAIKILKSTIERRGKAASYAVQMREMLKRWQKKLNWQFHRSGLYPERSIREDDWQGLIDDTVDLLERVDNHEVEVPDPMADDSLYNLSVEPGSPLWAGPRVDMVEKPEEFKPEDQVAWSEPTVKFRLSGSGENKHIYGSHVSMPVKSISYIYPRGEHARIDIGKLESIEVDHSAAEVLVIIGKAVDAKNAQREKAGLSPIRKPFAHLESSRTDRGRDSGEG